MRVGRFINRHVIDEGRQIRAVVQVVPAQQVLVCLTFAAMQGDNQSGHSLQQLPGAVGRCQLQFLVCHDAFACRCGGAEQAEPLCRDSDLW